MKKFAILTRIQVYPDSRFAMGMAAIRSGKES
jgi:hypothetical protein